MPHPQQQTANNNNENALDFLWLIVMLVVGVTLIWYFGKSYIANAVFTVRYYEIVAIDYVLNGWMKFVQLAHLPLHTPNTQDLTQWSGYIQSKPGEVSFTVLNKVSTIVGNYLRYPFAIILMGLAFLVYRANMAIKFKTIFNMQRLKTQEEKDWPQIVPVANLDLVKQELNEGPWAMALTPMEFSKQNNLLKFEENNGQKTVSLISGAAYRVFALQLGSIWTRAEKLPIHAQALFAIFAARANRDREAADQLLLQITASANLGKLNFAGTQELLAKHVNSKLAAGVTSQHAYLYAVMASMLELARTDGVLATAEFLWLKPVDRKLWYMLNSVGRQTVVPEVAGAFAHWIAEKRLARPLKVPMVDEAVKALDAALKEIIYEPEET